MTENLKLQLTVYSLRRPVRGPNAMKISLLYNLSVQVRFSHSAATLCVCVGTEAGVSVIEDAFCAAQSSMKVSRPGPSFFIQRRYRFILVSVAIFTFISSSCSFLYT